MLTIGRGAFDEMMRAVLAGGEVEVVGLLSGDDRVASHCHHLRNIAGPRAFAAHPYDQYQAEREIAHRGHVLHAVFHSHPGGGTRLSESDRYFARARPSTYVIVATRPNGRPDIGAFRVEGDRVTPVAVSISEFDTRSR
jgi:proteasome lid subunit RPN8/RPN11